MDNSDVEWIINHNKGNMTTEMRLLALIARILIAILNKK